MAHGANVKNMNMKPIHPLIPSPILNTILQSTSDNSGCKENIIQIMPGLEGDLEEWQTQEANVTEEKPRVTLLFPTVLLFHAHVNIH